MGTWITAEERGQLLDLIRSAIREELEASKQQGRAKWLTTEQAAMMLQIAPNSMEKARCKDRGPLASIPYHKMGRSVRYARTDIIEAVARLRVPGRIIKN